MLELPDVPPWEDAAAWSVHADRWLSDGDPRGAELDAELAGMPSSDARASRLRGEPGWPAEDVALDRLAEAHPAQLEVEWRHGFVLRAHVSDGPIAGQSLLQALLEAPAGRYLAELVVDTLWNDKVALGEPGRRGRVSWALTQLETSILPWLKTLQLGAASIEGDRFRGREFVLEQSNWTLGSPTEVFAPPDRLGPDLTTAVQHPSLRTLRIYGECLQLGPLNLPRLNELDVQGRLVPWPAVQAILASALPDLEKLRLWLGHRADDQAHKAGFTEPVFNCSADFESLWEERAPVEAEEAFLDHAPHQVGRIHLVDAIAEAALEAIPVQ